MLAQMLMTTSRSIRRVITLGTTGSSGGAGVTTLTYTNAPIGPADSSRVIVVCVAGGVPGGNRHVSTLTIGGSAATLATGSSAGSSSMATAIYYLAVPSGTKATIVATFNLDMDDMAMQVYSLVGWTSVTLYDSASAQGSASTSYSVSGFDTPAGGLSLCVAAGDAGYIPTVSGESGSANETNPYSQSVAKTIVSKLWASPAKTGANWTVSSSSATNKAISAASFI